MRLAGQKAAKAHAGVDEHMGFRLDAQFFRYGVEGGARLIGTDGTDGALVQQLHQLVSVGGGAEHQNRLLGKPSLTQTGDILCLLHGEMGNALLPQELGQLNETCAVGIAYQNGKYDGRTRPFLNDGGVVLDGGAFKNQLFHGNTTTFCREISNRK